jgi:hypothetical protein
VLLELMRSPALAVGVVQVFASRLRISSRS